MFFVLNLEALEHNTTSDLAKPYGLAKSEVVRYFQLSKILEKDDVLRNVLTHYHTIPQYALKIYSCGKHCEKRRNCL